MSYCSFVKVDLEIHLDLDQIHKNGMQIHSPKIKGEIREGKEGGRDGKGKDRGEKGKGEKGAGERRQKER